MVAGFAIDADVDYVSAGLGKGGGEAAGEADQSYAEAWKDGQETQEFLAASGVGERDEDVAAAEQAEVAVEGFGGMKELRWRSGGEQGCADLAGDESALADSRENGAMAVACGLGEEGCYVLKDLSLRAFEAASELLESLGFDADELGGAAKRGC